MTEKLDYKRRILCEAVEKTINLKMRTPKDFDYLREQIYQKLSVLISQTTLKRIWGYITEDSTPRDSSLTVLAQFAGFPDYETFCEELTDDDPPSAPILGMRLPIEELSVGDRIILRWDPLRVCVIEFLGHSAFRVISSEKTRLQPDDTFSCSTIIEGEPMYLDNLVQGGHLPVGYVCGKKGGISYEVIH
ncbi:MAG: hypothetical protein IJT55_06355 [Prevotella sp.]|nr:hypothetical protein [Prevotella sp.]